MPTKFEYDDALNQLPVVDNCKEVHLPVMYREVMKYFSYIKETGGDIFDCTLGLGGHSSGLLRLLNQGNKGHLYSIDKDKRSIAIAEKKLKQIDPKGDQHSIIHGPYSKISEYIYHMGLQGGDGFLFDFGVSSPQYDNPGRGFSYRFRGPLDMRMDQHDFVQVTAYDLCNSLMPEDLYEIFRTYSDEKFAREIAFEIYKHVITEGYIFSTDELESVCIKVYNKHHYQAKHPASKIFTALRVVVNSEFMEIQRGLAGALEYTKIGGRVAVITFSSEEDKIAMDVLKRYTTKREEYWDEWSMPQDEQVPEFKWVCKKAFPKEDEVERNPRSRSAILRVVERVNFQRTTLDPESYENVPYHIHEYVEAAREMKKKYFGKINKAFYPKRR